MTGVPLPRRSPTPSAHTRALHAGVGLLLAAVALVWGCENRATVAEEPPPPLALLDFRCVPHPFVEPGQRYECILVIRNNSAPNVPPTITMEDDAEAQVWGGPAVLIPSAPPCHVEPDPQRRICVDMHQTPLGGTDWTAVVRLLPEPNAQQALWVVARHGEHMAKRRLEPPFRPDPDGVQNQPPYPCVECEGVPTRRCMGPPPPGEDWHLNEDVTLGTGADLQCHLFIYDEDPGDVPFDVIGPPGSIPDHGYGPGIVHWTWKAPEQLPTGDATHVYEFRFRVTDQVWPGGPPPLTREFLLTVTVEQPPPGP